jgi:hypothetical protein
VPIGPRFNNEVLQTLLVLLRKVPPKQRKLLVFASTSALHILESMDLAAAFSVTVRVPTLGSEEIQEVFKQTNAFIPGDIEACSNIFVDGIGEPLPFSSPFFGLCSALFDRSPTVQVNCSGCFLGPDFP